MRIIIANIYSRFLLFFEPVLRKLHLMRLWSIATYLTRRRDAAFTPTVYGPSLATNWSDHQFYLCVTGRSGFKLHDILRQDRQKDFIFVDIGANVGLYSMLAGQNPRCCQTYAIDPNPIVFEQLLKNIDHSHIDGIKALNVGIANKNGTKTFSYKNWHRGLGNFLEKGDHQIDVEVRDYTLFDELHDAHAGKPIFLKIDVEGYEPEVVRQVAVSHMCYDIDEVFIEISPKWVSAKGIDLIFSTLREIGLKEVWRSSTTDQYDVYFKRPIIYKQVEQERTRLKSWEVKGGGAPRYSICVSNYNMADTLERAMTSVINQLDEQYEVLVIDDGSSDKSVEVLQKLAKHYDRFRFIALSRDRRRLLGETRNISIRAARGEYVLLHIDADDVWEPYLMDFVTLFHKIEATMKRDFLLVGQQTGIAKRSFLLSYGPYDNIYRCEDRNMMFHLAYQEKILYMDYRVYRTRLVRPPGKKFIKVLRDSWSQMMYDMRLEGAKRMYIWDALRGPFTGSQFSKKLTILRALIVIPTYLVSRSKEKIVVDIGWDEFREHRLQNRGTYSELMTRLGGDPDMSFLGSEAREIFSYNEKSLGFSNQK